MWSTNPLIAPGDTVILWLTREAIQPLLIEPGKEFNSKFGSYRHSELVGVPYGSKVPSRTGKGFIHVLRPTPELWTLALPHRTQILYLADISFVTAYLGITSGSVVVEAGTGSGSFSHSTLRTIGPTGHLFSYEFHQNRLNKAKTEFAEHGFDTSRVTLELRNVCKDGFGDNVLKLLNRGGEEEEEGARGARGADAVFLDLPAPWDAVESAKRVLRKDKQTRICCFSPCIEQVLRTVTALNDAGFSDITTYETLLRPHDISSVPSLPTIAEARSKIVDIEVRKEEKRVLQVMSGHRGNPGKQAKDQDGKSRDAGVGEKRKREAKDKGDSDEKGEEGKGDEQIGEVEDSNSDVGGGKRIKVEREDRAAGDVRMEVDIEPDSVARPEGLTSTSGSSAEQKILTRVMPEVRGHTSYLTFACLLPQVVETPSMRAKRQKGEKVEMNEEETQEGNFNGEVREKMSTEDESNQEENKSGGDKDGMAS
ncbi:tRNA methyltransferase complex GCD14 subunit [Dendrothele bispora CBS 962.96]|uniref:tRNA (adenine(58)-N(1))-methyltransferase catalytic subunit TRM61 n=1 Tax=Dendrothele bispora (strain CBS 962.96) TaxID=1314807 RepID=A0A4S8M4I0_DENBC|nr:tRNA methyltransferase complex GCD14 subunit [Dendrothele bispora CBS 962.96]